jgi:hypothetical protein
MVRVDNLLMICPLLQELQIGESDMQSYITTFRNMSIMDLQYSHDPCTQEDDDAMRNEYSEVPDADMKMAGALGPSAHAPDSHSSPVSPDNYGAMG